MFKRPFQTIVVGVDFSQYSKLVLEQAFRLAQFWNSQIVLVHALNEPLAYIPTPLLAYQSFPKVNTYKKRIKEFYNIKNKKIKIVVGYDTPTLLIRSVAKMYSQSLMMVGYMGHSTVTEFLFGSTARNLALGGPSAVWIHRGSKVVNPFRILVPIDLTRASNRAIDVCKDLNLVRPLTYQAYFVREKPLPILDYSLYIDMEQEQVKSVQKSFRKIFSLYPRLPFQSVTGEVTEKIVQKSKDFDLILMSHRRPYSMLRSSETARLMSAAKVPVLVV